VSVELEQGGKTVFSFQIANRSAQIDATIEGMWPGGLGLDSFDELVASKMSALVERGAPRDFRDIHSLCEAGLCNAARCWQLWETRQRLARQDADGARARSAIVTHLSRLAVARPLNRITDAEQREKAARLRAWFEKEFLA
jgi:predicted nucleotidyltransferase component of viral defense system